jgi:hypothetical protein
MPVVVSGVANALANVTNAVTNTMDASKRRKYEQNLANLSFDQKVKLDKELANAKSDADKQALLGNVLGGLSSSRIDALSRVQVEREKTKKIIIILGISFTLVVSSVLIYMKLKKQ